MWWSGGDWEISSQPLNYLTCQLLFPFLAFSKHKYYPPAVLMQQSLNNLWTHSLLFL